MQLGDLVLELRAAFEDEKALGHAINNRQDPQSANRLNGRVQALLQVGNARELLMQQLLRCTQCVHTVYLVSAAARSPWLAHRSKLYTRNCMGFVPFPPFAALRADQRRRLAGLRHVGRGQVRAAPGVVQRRRGDHGGSRARCDVPQRQLSAVRFACGTVVT